jgi:hypothetical protein
MIYGVQGEFSSGKTLFMTYRLIQAMYAGRRVITNYPIKIDWAPAFKPKKHLESECYTSGYEFRQKIETEKDCIFGCDETAIYLPMDFWNKMSEEIRFKLHLVEHFRTDLYYTVQDFSESVVMLRRLTNMVFQCEKWNFGLFIIFINKKYKKKYFEGMPTDKKHELYFRGLSFIFPSDTKRIVKAYQREYKFAEFKVNEFTRIEET